MGLKKVISYDCACDGDGCERTPYGTNRPPTNEPELHADLFRRGWVFLLGTGDRKVLCPRCIAERLDIVVPQDTVEFSGEIPLMCMECGKFFDPREGTLVPLPTCPRCEKQKVARDPQPVAVPVPAGVSGPVEVVCSTCGNLTEVWTGDPPVCDDCHKNKPRETEG